MLYSTFSRIAIAVFLAALILALFFLPYNSVRNHAIKQYNKEQMVQARQVADGIEEYFKTYTQALRYFASQPSVIDLDKSGRALLEDFYAIHTVEVIALTRVDASGKILYTAPFNEDAIGKDVSHQQHNREVMQTHKLTVSDPFEAVQGVTTVAFAYPVMKNGYYDGTITLLIPFVTLVQRNIQALRLDERSVTSVISRKGLVLYCPQGENIGRSILDIRPDNQEFTNLIRRRMNGEQGTGRFTAAGLSPDAKSTSPEGYQAVFLPVRLPGDNYWSAGINTPESLILRSIVPFGRQWLLITCLVTVLFIFFGLTLNYFIGKSVRDKSMRETQRQMINLLEFTPIGIVVTDLRGVIAYCNDAVLQILNLIDKSQAIRHPLLEFIHREDQEFVRSRIGVQRSSAPETLEFARVFTHEGELRDVEIYFAPFVFSGRDSCIVLMRNVTEARRLEQSRQLLAIAMEQAKESVVITDQDGIIEYANPAFCKISGYLIEEAVGKSIRILESNRYDSSYYEEMWKTLTSGRVWQGKFVSRRKDGGLNTEQCSISPVRNDKNEIIHYVAVKRDISHEVELEDKLQQAQKMEAIGTLAGGIAHDFNNILGAMLGFTELSLLKTDPKSQVHENLLHIRKGGKRAADLVQQILTFSRHSRQQRHAISVVPLLKESIKLLRSTLPSTIDIEQEILVQDLKVEADPVHMQQIVMNLGTNAYHAMQDKGGTLTIKLMSRFDDDGVEKLVLEVNDVGHGMDAETQERIFDPFFTTKEPGHGTGMGLSVVHGIVQDLGGEIYVSSIPGEGTSFSIVLPMADPDLLVVEDDLEEDVGGGDESIVIVDDENEIREPLEKFLRSMGYTVTGFSNPVDALKMLCRDEGSGIDLVITDQTMPLMTGANLIVSLQRARPDLPVIVCTGYSHELDEKKALALGAKKLLMKPVDYPLLLKVIREIFDNL